MLLLGWVEALNMDGHVRAYEIMVTPRSLRIMSTEVPLANSHAKNGFDVRFSEIANGPRDIQVLFGSSHMWGLTKKVESHAEGVSLIETEFGAILASREGDDIQSTQRMTLQS